MPRTSDRSKLIARIDVFMLVALKHSLLLKVLRISSTNADDLVYRCRKLKRHAKYQRYLRRGPYCKRTEKFNLYLDQSSDDCVDKNEFHFHFCVSRANFWELLKLLEDNPAMKRKNSDSQGPLPKPAAHQLLILMKYYGCEGNQSSSKALSAFFGVASGEIDCCHNNALLRCFVRSAS